MDIDYPEHIVERVNAALAEHGERDGVSYVVDVTGHGAAKYASVWQGLRALGSVVDGSVLDAGKAGLAVFATTALSCELRGDGRADRTVVPAPAGRRSTEPTEARARPCRCR